MYIHYENNCSGKYLAPRPLAFRKCGLLKQYSWMAVHQRLPPNNKHAVNLGCDKLPAQMTCSAIFMVRTGHFPLPLLLKLTAASTAVVCMTVGERGLGLWLAGWPFQHLSTLKIQRYILKTPSILVRLPIFKIHTGDLSSKHLCEDSIEIYFYFPWDFSPNQYNIQVFLSYCRFSFCLPTAHYMIHFRKISLVEKVYNVWTQTRAKNMRKWNIHRVSDACLSLFYSP